MASALVFVLTCSNLATLVAFLMRETDRKIATKLQNRELAYRAAAAVVADRLREFQRVRWTREDYNLACAIFDANINKKGN